MPNGFSDKQPPQKNSYESWRSDLTYGPGRGVLEFFWWVVLIGIGGPMLLGLIVVDVDRIIRSIAAGVFVASTTWCVSEILKQQKAKVAKLKAATETYVVDPVSQVKIIRSGPSALTAYFCSDWNRWLTESEIKHGVQRDSKLRFRRAAVDPDDRQIRLWEDNSETWLFKPYTDEWIRLT